MAEKDLQVHAKRTITDLTRLEPSPAAPIAAPIDRPNACVGDEIRQTPAMSKTTSHFSERDFYLAEFRRRSIGFAWPADEAADHDVLARLVEELVANQIRVVLLSARDDVLESMPWGSRVVFETEEFAPRLWRALKATGCAGLRIRGEDFEAECRRAAISLRLAKVVWIQSTPPITRRSVQGRISVVDLAHLDRLLDLPAVVGGADASDESRLEAKPERRALLESIRDLIQGGVPSVNVCAPHEIEQELLTYAGAGTFFTRDRYAEVRKLALDDFDQANDLIARGEADGFLVPRDEASRDAVLAHGVGLFIEGRYLAGIGAMLPYPEERAVEVASLYALTRYVGEGVGGQIVRHAIERAVEEGLAYVFSCTTSDRVESFFLRHGFRTVGVEEVPKAKWENYAEERRHRVRCLRFDP
jgi:N-acetylglutamate synthase-like GNAT family acetyltransferase